VIGQSLTIAASPPFQLVLACPLLTSVCGSRGFRGFFFFPASCIFRYFSVCFGVFLASLWCSWALWPWCKGVSMSVTSSIRYSYFLGLVNTQWIPISRGLPAMLGVDLEIQYNVRNLTLTSLLCLLGSTGNIAPRRAYSIGLLFVRLSGCVRSAQWSSPTATWWSLL